MKKLNIFLFTVIIALNLFSCNNVFSQTITRGPNIGEIYFLGPTHTGTGLYYSTDFGETAVCVDSIKDLHSVEADKLNGGIYGLEIPPNLYFSSNYGYSGSWEYKTSGMFPNLSSGISDGYVYNNIESHSENYGNTFNYHNFLGYFGNLISGEIDSQQSNGYAAVYKSNEPDSIYILFSNDNFDNCEVSNIFPFHWSNEVVLSHASESGNIFLINISTNELYFSDDFANSFLINNVFNFSESFNKYIEGGRQNGELYILYNFVNMMWQNAHTYILHSTDYGVTFEVFHPFAKGQQPILANFSTPVKEGNQPLTVEFCNFSIGNIQEYEWDFDNDGIVDSNEESPSWTYWEPGTYSVSLTITAGTPDSTNTFVKEDYIMVLSGNSQEIDLNPGYQFISSNRSPENPNMLEVLENNLNYNLDFVRNSQGQMFQNIGGNWVNGIGDWISTEGYLFKMNEADVLIIDGTTVNPQTPIELNTGYQFVSYLPNETLNALEAFGSILNDDLDFIRNSNGGTLRKIGTNWVNGIGDCNQGEGFLVRMNGGGILVYPTKL